MKVSNKFKKPILTAFFIVFFYCLGWLLGYFIGQRKTEKYYDPIVKEAIGWEYGETNLTHTCQHFCESEFEKFGC